MKRHQGQDAEMTRAEFDALAWEPVRSTNVGAIAFKPTAQDKEMGALFVRFGRRENVVLYRYDDMPRTAAVSLRESNADPQRSVGAELAKVRRGHTYCRVRVADK